MGKNMTMRLFCLQEQHVVGHGCVQGFTHTVRASLRQGDSHGSLRPWNFTISILFNDEWKIEDILQDILQDIFLAGFFLHILDMNSCLFVLSLYLDGSNDGQMV